MICIVAVVTACVAHPLKIHIEMRHVIANVKKKPAKAPSVAGVAVICYRQACYRRAWSKDMNMSRSKDDIECQTSIH